MSQEQNSSSKSKERSIPENRHLPKPDQLVVISEGVYEGDVVEGAHKQEIAIFEMASGDISVWVDGGIHLKINAPGTDLLNWASKKH